MIVSPGLFFPDREDQRALFVRTVTNIEIEISSYCNRRCSFCPNSFLDRISEKRQMDDALFSSIISQLGELEWRGTIRFHRYNEPLADREYVLRRLEACRALAPSASVLIQTNGDYLNRSYLEAIYEAGCRNIFWTAYLKEGAAYDDASAVATIEDRLRRLEVPYEFVLVQPGVQVVARVSLRGMDFLVRSLNFQARASNRGGCLGTYADGARVQPCLRPFDELQIECDGTLMPCCELRSDYPEHRGCRMGRLQAGASLVEAWASESYVAWRKALFSFEPKQGPCTTCGNPSLPDSPEARQTIELYRQRVGLD
jgi:iron-sulfur cluster protein/radical SAM family protein